VGITEVAETIHKIEQFGIKVYEGSGEVWYDCHKHLGDKEMIRLGLYSQKVQENKHDFLEFLWRRDRENSYNKRESKLIVDGMCGLRGFKKV
jgi:hypothetical protein